MITLDQVLSGRNILRATKQVVSNKGAPGIDGMTVDQYEAHHRRHWRSIAEHIRREAIFRLRCVAWIFPSRTEGRECSAFRRCRTA